MIVLFLIESSRC